MGLKRLLLHVTPSEEGWIIKTGQTIEHLGPFFDREDALAKALLMARSNNPSHVKVTRSARDWWIECTCRETPLPITPPA